MLTAIIVAAGSSVRVGFDKIFALLDDRPVFAHSLEAFERCTDVGEIIVVGRADRLVELEAIGRTARKLTHVIAGGARRQDSVRAGLDRMARETNFVAVHDAARPLVTPELIAEVFKLARAHGAATTAAPVVDTLKRATPERVVCGSVDREALYAMQTPQIFARKLLERAYAETVAAGIAITDEVSAVERIGGKVVLAPNADFNFKITYPADLALAEFVLQRRRVAISR